MPEEPWRKAYEAERVWKHDFKWRMTQAKEKENYFRFLVHIQGTALIRCWQRVGWLTLWAAFVFYVWETLPKRYQWTMGAVSHTMTLIPLGFLLIFRTTNAYQKYWHARGTLDKIPITCRKAAGLVFTKGLDVPKKAAEEYTRHLALMNCVGLLSLPGDIGEVLNHNDAGGALNPLPRDGYCTPEEKAMLEQHRPSLRPVIALGWLSEAAAACFTAKIQGPVFHDLLGYGQALNDTYVELSLYIKTTLPFPYTHMLRVAMVVWLATLPFAITDEVKGGSVYVAFFLSFTMFGLEALGSELEDPLGLDPNDWRPTRWARKGNELINCFDTSNPRPWPEEYHLADKPQWLFSPSIEPAHHIEGEAEDGRCCGLCYRLSSACSNAVRWCLCSCGVGPSDAKHVADHAGDGAAEPLLKGDKAV